jgi:hypothetical protein
MLTSCKNQSDTPAPQQQPAATADAPRDTLPGAPPPAGLSGVWTIVAHYIPDIAGMTAAQADAWIGRSIRLGSEIVTEGVRCARPSYTKITLDRDNFLTGAFNLPPGAIMRLANVDAMNVTTVTCEGRALGGLGQLIMEVDADHILSTWDGVFFELERDQDLRALGQEPSWRLDLTKGMNLRLARPGQPDLIMPAPAGKTDPQTGRRTYHAASDRDNLLIVIEPTRCTDPVSGEAFENSVTLTLNGDVLRGCGGPLPVE